MCLLSNRRFGTCAKCVMLLRALFQDNLVSKRFFQHSFLDSRIGKSVNAESMKRAFSASLEAEVSKGNFLQDGNKDIVWNPCNIQMIPDSLHGQIFTDTYRRTEFETEVIAKCREHLEAHSLWNQKVKPIPSVNDLIVPELQGEDINDHFKNIALQQTFRYKKLLNQLLCSEIPVKPSEWKFAVRI